ncbi:MAG: hypothetical protein JNL03_01015 [Prolixibacteraceae bacterium]|nr:hypothetical protein [Prolixibacteraceae bacterium]
MAAADSLYFFSSGNWQQPTTIIFSGKEELIHIPEERKKQIAVLKPDRLFLFHSMKRAPESCQNEPSAGRFDGLPTRSD